MPCLNISTNVSLESVDPSAVLSETTKAVAKIIGKPESYVMVVLKGSIPISFGGTQQAAAYAVRPKVTLLSEVLRLQGQSSTRTCSVFACFASAIGFRLWMEWFYVLNLEL
ncbi:hypothetical protein OPV22_033992 [Ensete ventricosum]|uniref:Uncharacterized protein n=1 Tax=Ensete ventricosum TaxID=4639 RepID=A0AAV8P1D1_ENSVE|nr:hypothetical protein OPV22_033992 [Ensete ventricosum]